MRFHADCHLPLQIAATLPALLAIMGPASYSLAADQGVHLTAMFTLPDHDPMRR